MLPHRWLCLDITFVGISLKMGYIYCGIQTGRRQHWLSIGWIERNQQDATNLMFIIKLLSQHVSGIIMPSIRRTKLCTAAYGVLHWLWWLWLCGGGTRAVCTVKVTVRPSPYAAVHKRVLLMMGIMMPETCWDKSLIINIRLVAHLVGFSLFTLRSWCTVTRA